MCSGAYYSPKIREDLIPILYRLRKQMRKPMTTVVDQILRDDRLVFSVTCYPNFAGTLALLRHLIGKTL